MKPTRPVSTVDIHISEISNGKCPTNTHCTISFRNVKYTLNGTCMDHRRRRFCPSYLRPKPPQIILNRASGIFTSGMNAIMGPTGCGKSTLLDVLAGRKDRRKVSGEIFIDGSPVPSSFKYMVGYVVQDDILSGTLTVRENLMFSANLRLSSEMPLTERQTRVEKIIDELGLRSCADNRIGTEFLRGVSGGERKRTCIGMELVLEPKVLFLDEPTTGLDAATARNVIQCLSQLSKSGRTIIFSIHQPRYSIFKLFDRVLLMSKGFCVYQGSAENIVDYFNQQGYQCELHDNPADFALDVLTDANHDDNQLNKLIQTYENSSMFPKVQNDIDEQINESPLKTLTNSKNRHFIRREIYYVSIRTITNAVRNPELFFSQTFVAILLGLLVGLVFYQMKLTMPAGASNRLGAIFVMIVSQIFSTVTALESLLKERVLFIHENVSGYYRTSTFFLTKVICDILPMRILPSIVYSFLTYFLIGLQQSTSQFFIFLITIFMASVFGSATCFLISATIPVFSVALIVVVSIYVIMMIFSGFIVELSSIFSWLSWIQWLSAFRYASNMLTINEFYHIHFCSENQTIICPFPGTNILKQKHIAYETFWDMWQNFFALTMMAIGFLFLAFIQLFRMKRTK